MIELIFTLDKLHRECYRFYLENEYRLWLDNYALQKRETSRHKWIDIQRYSRLEPRYSTMKEEQVTLNDTIRDLIRKEFLSQLQIEKWSKRE